MIERGRLSYCLSKIRCAYPVPQHPCRRALGYSGYSGDGLRNGTFWAIFAGMTKRAKPTGAGEAPPVVSTLPPPEPVKAPRKRALPDDIPRGSLPAPKRKVAPMAKPAAAPPWDADKEAYLAKQRVIARAKAGVEPVDRPPGAIVIETGRAARPRKPRAAADHVETKLEPTGHGGALKRSTRERPDPRDTPPVKTGVPPAPPEPRPSMSDMIFRAICLELSEGVPLRQICRRGDMPSKTAFYEFLDGADLDGEDASAPDVRSGRLARYARARKLGYDALAEESLEIADDGTNDWVEREKEDGRLDVELDRDHIQRSKLRIETRLKLLAVWDPKRYGNMIKVGDPDAKPLDNGGKSASDIAIGMAKLLAAAKREAEQQGQEA